MSDIILHLKNITKVYDNGVVANKNVTIAFKKGEIHSVIGENGAGKSTIMKIAFGFEKASSGEIYFNGQKVNLNNSLEAIRLGIGMVHQHFMLIPNFTVLENIALGNEPHKNRFFFDRKEAERKVKELIETYHFSVDLDAKVSTLSVAAKQKVEILKTLYQNSKVIILDEPTAVLTPQETESLFEELIKLKQQGTTIVFISHKLNEIKKISDRITVMKDGENLGTFNNDISIEQLSEMIVSRDMVHSLESLKTSGESNQIILSIQDLSYQKDNKKILNNINLSIKEKEIVTLVGVQGNGQSELVQAITGLLQDVSGSVRLAGQELLGLTIKKRRELGLSYIPEDRMKEGVAAKASVMDNIISTYYEDLSGKIFMNRRKMTDLTKSLVEKFNIKTNSIHTVVSQLSGGNIQKVVVARENQNQPKLLIAEQPTRGIDIGSANFIHQQLIALRNNQAAVLLVTADLKEAFDLSDRIIVFYDGEIVASFSDLKNISEKELGLYMLGVKKEGNHNETV